MRSVIFIFLFTTFFSVKGQTSFNSGEARWKYALSLAQKYSPEAHEILRSVKDPSKDCYGYLGSETTKIGVLTNMGTLVHESCHGYNFFANEDFSYESYLLSAEDILTVKKGLLYNSNRLNKTVSKELQEYIFRYSTYIGDSSNLSSQVNGIYGLLDEFDCYYQETKLTMDLRKEFELVLGPKNGQGWSRDYIGGIASQVTAFYEFRLFFGWYLKYAKDHYPKIYADMMANVELRKALTKLYDQFEIQAKRYDAEVARVVKDLNANGIHAEVDEEWFKIYSSPGSWTGHGVNTKYIKRLTAEFEKESKAILTSFRIN